MENFAFKDLRLFKKFHFNIIIGRKKVCQFFFILPNVFNEKKLSPFFY
jgi:hypothetical protein